MFRKCGSHPTAGLDLVSKIRSDIDAKMRTAVNIMFSEKRRFINSVARVRLLGKTGRRQTRCTKLRVTVRTDGWRTEFFSLLGLKGLRSLLYMKLRSYLFFKQTIIQILPRNIKKKTVSSSKWVMPGV